VSKSDQNSQLKDKKPSLRLTGVLSIRRKKFIWIYDEAAIPFLRFDGVCSEDGLSGESTQDIVIVPLRYL